MKYFISILVLILILIGVAPYALSTNWGKGVITSKELKIDSVSLSWIGFQELKGVQYKDGDTNIAIDSLVLGDSLFQFILNGFSFEDLDVKGLNADLPLEEPERSKGHYSLIFLKKIKVSESSLTFIGKKQITFSDIAMDIELKRSEKKVTGHIFAKTTDGAGAGLVNVQGSYDPNSYALTSQIQNLPLSVIDRLIDGKGALSKAFGPTLNANIHAKDTEIKASIRSAYLAVDIDTSLSSNIAKIDWKPERNGKLSWDHWALTGNPDLQLSLHAFNLPRKDQKWQWDQLGVEGEFQAKEFDIQNIVQKLHYSISSGNGAFQSKNVSQKVDANGSITFSSPSLTGLVKFQGGLKNLFDPSDLDFIVRGENLHFLDGWKSDGVELKVAGETLNGGGVIFGTSKFLKGPVTLKINGEMKKRSPWRFALPKFTASMTSNDVHANAVGSLDQQLAILEPITASYILTPEIFSNVVDDLKLEENTQLQLEIAPFTYDFSRNILSYLKAKFISDSLKLSSIDLSNISGHLAYDQKEREFDVQMNSNISGNSDLDFALSAKNFNFSNLPKASYSFTANGKDVPTPLVAPWIRVGANLSSFLGSYSSTLGEGLTITQSSTESGWKWKISSSTILASSAVGASRSNQRKRFVSASSVGIKNASKSLLCN